MNFLLCLCVGFNGTAGGFPVRLPRRAREMGHAGGCPSQGFRVALPLLPQPLLGFGVGVGCGVAVGLGGVGVGGNGVAVGLGAGGGGCGGFG